MKWRSHRDAYNFTIVLSIKEVINRLSGRAAGGGLSALQLKGRE